jgi:hypothetical protein
LEGGEIVSLPGVEGGGAAGVEEQHRHDSPVISDTVLVQWGSSPFRRRVELWVDDTKGGLWIWDVEKMCGGLLELGGTRR